MTFEKWLEDEAKKRNVGKLHKKEEDAMRLGWKCCLIFNKEPVAKSPACNDVLCAELSLMVDVFNSCIETKTLPGKGSPCQKKIIELLDRCGKKPTALKVRGA